MKLENKVIDFCLSLVYAGKSLEEQKDYKELEKSVSSSYIKEIKEYQIFLQEYRKDIAYFVNEDYNLLLYIVTIYQTLSVEDLCTFLKSATQEDLFQIVSKQILDKEVAFSTKALLDIAMEEKNKWKLTELHDHYLSIKEGFLTILPHAWKRYDELVTYLERQFQDKIEHESQRLTEKSSQLYKMIYQDYITKEDYLSSEENYLFLVAFQQSLFIKNGESGILGLGLFAYDYMKLVKSIEHYDQESREKILKILADPTRFGILKLINEEVFSNKIIANKFGISSAAVSYQLKNLLEHDIIRMDSTSRKYRVNKDLLKQLFAGIEKELLIE